MSIGTETKCLICGNTFPNKSKFRPKEYCSDNCKDLSKFLHAFERNLYKVDFKEDYSNKLKSQLFFIANQIKCISKKDKNEKS